MKTIQKITLVNSNDIETINIVNKKLVKLLKKNIDYQEKSEGFIFFKSSYLFNKYISILSNLLSS